MAKSLDLTGNVYGDITVIEKVQQAKGNVRGILWKCVCSCGVIKELPACDLNNGKHKSCGCKRKEKMLAALVIGRQNSLKVITTHGAFVKGRNPDSYWSWKAMMRRCYDSKSYSKAKFDNHGGRGITVCERWHTYENFVLDMGEPPAPDMSIERNGNNGNYEPSNCRWATRIEQGRNKRNNHLLTFNGETRCLSEWAEILGMKWNTLNSRLVAGWTVESAFTTPVRGAKKNDKKE